MDVDEKLNEPHTQKTDFDALVQKVSQENGIDYSEAYNKVMSILAQPLNSTAQIVVLMDSTDKPPTILLALATRLSQELFEGEELERAYHALTTDTYIREDILNKQGKRN